MEFQIRSTDGSLRFFGTFKEALEVATRDKTIWKISFSLTTGERIRLIRSDNEEWVLNQIK